MTEVEDQLDLKSKREEHESEKSSRRKERKREKGHDKDRERDSEVSDRSKDIDGEKTKVKSREKDRDRDRDHDRRRDDDGKKNLKKLNANSEAGDGGKKKKKKKNKEFGDEKEERLDDANKKTKKRKREEIDLGAEENTDNEIKRSSKKKKKKVSIESEVDETSFNSTKDAKKKSSENSEAKEIGLNSTKDAKKKSKKKKKKKQNEVSEAEENDNDGEDAKKKKKKKQQNEVLEAEKNDNVSEDAKKKKKKKKQSEVSEAEENNNEGENAKEKRKKKKKQSEVSEAEENNNEGENAKEKRKKKESVTTPSSKSSKKVKFSDQVEYFPAEDEERDEGEEEKEEEEEEGEHQGEDDGMVRGKRFTKEEDELLKKTVLDYIDNHALGEEGLNMVMDCRNHKEVKGCWKEIASALPWRPRYSVYSRAHTIFQRGSKGVWTKEDLELVKQFQEKHGNDWKTLADAMGKYRIHVKDAWRRIRLNMNKGHWSRQEYQSLFDLVNKDIRMKAYQEKHSKHGMLRDNIPWMAISDVIGTRSHISCCAKWYDQLISPMIKQGEWDNVDDYRLMEELLKLDAACVDDVDWDNLLENRDGEACRKRWDQMVRHIGLPKSKTFAEHVEILSERYCPELAEDRENFDNRPYDDEDDDDDDADAED